MRATFTRSLNGLQGIRLVFLTWLPSARKRQLTGTVGLSVNLLALLALTHLCFPRARRHTRKFTQLSYFNPETNEYTIGWDDACFVFHWIVLFSGLRAAAIDYILVPFAQWGGIEKKKDLTRFAEQAWLLIYYIFFIPIGVVRSPNHN